MSAKIIDGRSVATKVRNQVKLATESYYSATGRRPGLATVLVGHDPASHVYINNKRKQCVAAGMVDLHHPLPAEVAQEDLEALLRKLAADDSVSGVLLQLPVPEHLDASALLDCIPAHKDVDGLTTESAGLLARGLRSLRPCTPAGVIELLRVSEIEVSGRHAVIVGRSQLVGKPLSQLLLQSDATVTVAHSRTQNLPSITRDADIIIAAAGVPHLIGATHVKPGATVIDVGIHRTRDGLRGDVDFDAVVDIAGALTPVPGGVGPMTIAMLLSNTLQAATFNTQGMAASVR
ncbi:bifunctional methylenetetrahydrofolate dehydrogenase/methenyltetrahydrofolate cyclohydrolase FolD [Rhodococcus sp. T2V]|uniref:bifunctional methylenetetrahydrofolate dehydrogenase/methenyltetrahydrofolate cyclohydrolase FolD n=1 Tax=Rhodococcus sp. T2V TaxID=3034164 RepID=UPI0023E211F1|nr:bifunctional methylenetetrahydrofolate dehydrogenase/methenyltetrahydrofolate cyclohydrolase FolD [Rhodococcus sp. T2V]MDF3312591.1 bifunctional methylenetetrahydrofolate dehydrogenase/methenyltetrahydrofolate cyclohydrolase FolD [Rhodococcus sp. T2V]